MGLRNSKKRTLLTQEIYTGLKETRQVHGSSFLLKLKNAETASALENLHS